MSKVIGIDLGTTNSCMAVLEGGEPTVIANAEGGRTTPSVVAFAKDGDRLVGVTAKRQRETNPKNTIFSIKRFMGRKKSEVSEEMTMVPYDVVAGPNDDVRVKAGDEELAPPELSAMILQKLKADAEAYLGETVTDAVITVPAYFNDAQRQATKDAGKIAGLNVLRIINEPTAAALAYGLDKDRADQTILVFDLGGGTFDVSVLELGEGVFEVKSTSGDNHLGGDNFDKAVVDWMVAEFKREQGIDLSKDPMALQRLYDKAEEAKIQLSSAQSAPINLPFIALASDGPRHLELTLTRAKLNEVTHDLVERTVGPVKQALKDAGLEAKDIEQVILVGGMTRMPAVGDKVKEVLGKEPHRGVNPDEVVAVGAAIQAGVLKGEVKDVLLLDVTPLSLGIETKGGVMTQADRAQHDHPDAQVGDLLHRGGRPDVGRDPRAPGRARDGRLQQDARQVPARRHPAGAARRAAGRGHVRHRRQRHPLGLGQGSRHRQRAEDRGPLGLRPGRRRDRAHGQGRRGARRRRQAAARARRRQEPGRDGDLLGREVPARARRQGRRATSRRTIETAAAELRTALEGDDAERDPHAHPGAARGLLQARRGRVPEHGRERLGSRGGRQHAAVRRGRGRGHRGRRDRGRGRPRAVVSA